MTTSSHRDKAIAHLDASLAARDHLTEIYQQQADGRPVDRARIAELHETIRLGVKLAQVRALLAIEDRLSDLYDAPADVLAEVGLSAVAEPRTIHHPSCPARSDLFGACICPGAEARA